MLTEANAHSFVNNEFLWGVAAIGAAINRNRRQTYHLLSTGQIKSAQKRGGIWCAHRTALRREFGAVEQREEVA